MPASFTEKVIRNIHAIPEGTVATYGQIAKLSGKPQGSRGVAWILHSSSTRHKLPWQRVINSKGSISFEFGTHNFRKQKKLLEKEGVEVDAKGNINLRQFQWKKKPRTTTSSRKASNRPKIFS